MGKFIRFAAPLLAACASPALAASIADLDGATVAATPATQTVQFEVYLPLRDKAGLEQLLKDQQTPGSASYHKWISASEFGRRFGPTAAAMNTVKAAALAAGFKVVGTNARSFVMTGSAAQIGASFKTALKTKTLDGSSHVVASGLTLPSAFASVGAKVYTFRDLLVKKPLVSVAKAKLEGAAPANRTSARGPYWYNDLKQAYDYPSYQSTVGGNTLDGTGVGVAILMSDKPAANDINLYFNHEKFTTNTGKTPTYTVYNINGGGTTTGGGALEAALDIEQVLGGAPGASVTLVSLPNLSDANITAGYTYIVNNPSKFQLVNSSFGGCELAYTAAYNNGVDYTDELLTDQELFEQGNSEGITFMASSGDEGGLECPDAAYFYGHDPRARYVASVSNPADSPNVTAVGGGNIVTNFVSGSLDSSYVSENGNGDPEKPTQPYGAVLGVIKNGYWGAGGGQSAVYQQPTYQGLVNTGSTMRTLPDVGMQVGGCPSSAIQPCGPNRSAVYVYYNSSLYSVIGTSVSSPEFVGAVALYVQANGPQGNFNPFLYAKGAAQTAAGGVNAPADSQFYHRGMPGFDGYWSGDYPTLDYNYIFGNGTPDVRKLLDFTSTTPAGVPQTASNP